MVSEVEEVLDQSQALSALNWHEVLVDFEAAVLEDSEAPSPQLPHLLASNWHLLLEDFEAPIPQLQHMFSS